MEKEFMRLAIEWALKGVKTGQTPFGACIVKKGKIIACEHNVVWKTKDITAHAEVTAIRAACLKLNSIDLSGCVLYSTCEPCPMCFSAIHWARIEKVYYGARIADAKRAGFHELSVSNRKLKNLGKSPVHIRGPRMREECLKLFDEFEKKGSAKLY